MSSKLWAVWFWTVLWPNFGQQFGLVKGISGLCVLHESCSPMSNLSNGIEFRSFGLVWRELWPNELVIFLGLGYGQPDWNSNLDKFWTEFGHGLFMKNEAFWVWFHLQLALYQLEPHNFSYKSKTKLGVPQLAQESTPNFQIPSTLKLHMAFMTLL